MKTASESGNLTEALRLYATLYELMDQELGMEPSAPTQDLVVRIKQGERLIVPMDTETAVPNNDQTRVRKTAHSEPLVHQHTEPIVAVAPMRFWGSPDIARHLPEMLVDDVVCKLAQMNEISVISTNSTRQLIDADISPSQVNEQFGANYVLMTKIGSLDSRFKLSVELIDTRSQIVKWAQIFEPNQRDLLETQSRIAAEIAAILVPQIHLSELKVTSGYSINDLTAYHMTLRARQILFDLDVSTFGDALVMLKGAIEKEPNFAQAHYAVADWYSLNIGQGWSTDPQRELKELETFARKAARLDLVGGRALALLAHNEAIYSREYAQALKLFQRATEAMPNDAETLLWSSPTLAYVGQHEEA